MTKEELIADALRLCGALGASEPVDPTDQQLVDRTLRRMVGDWANQFLTAYAHARTQFNLTSGQSVYTLGPTGNWVAPRPTVINGWSVIPDRTITDTIEIPRGRPTTLEQWQRIGVKTTTGAFPSHLYPDNTISSAGLTNVTVYPVPDNSLAAVVLYMPVSIPQFAASMSLDVVLPDGYEQALVTNLAILAAPYFKGTAVSPDVRLQAQSSLDNLKAQNWRERPIPNTAPWGPGGHYNIYTDEYQ
jgi:hypothetical protein